MRIPGWLLRLLPMWDYICPKCRKAVEKGSGRCVHCGEVYGCPVRVPSRALKDPEALEEYVHRHIFPRVSRAQREYLAQYFTEIFSDGFESGNLNAWTGTSVNLPNTLTVVDTKPHHGTYSCKATNAGGTNAFAYKTFTGQDEAYVRAYFSFAALPSANGEDIWFLEVDESPSLLVKVSLYHDGSNVKLRAHSFITGSYYSGALSLSTDTWYCIDLHIVRDNSAGVIEVYLDGSKEIEQTGIDTDTGNQMNQIRVGHINSDVATDVYVDCVVVADTYIGPETGGATYTRTWATDALFKKLGIIVGDGKRSTVESGASAVYGTLCSFQRKSFYANGRFWCFYANSSNDVVYRTSTDGLSWSDETFVRDGGSYGPNVSIFFDGTYVHYAANSTGSYPWESAIYYRRGAPNSNGAITWSAAEQTVNTAYNKASNPHIGVDSNGYAWIGYRDSANGTKHAYVIRSGNNDGTWGTTPDGFPYQLSDDLRLTWAVSPVPLTNGKMAMVYVGHDSGSYVEPVHVRVWNGSSWETEVTTTSTSYHSMFHSAVAEGDDVHIAFMKFVDSETPLEIMYVKYDYGTNSLGAETSLQSGIPYEDDGTDYCAPVITRDTSRNELYVFWGFYPEYAHIYYRKWNGSSWESRVDWLNESADGFIADHTWSSFYVSNDGFMGLLYQTGSSSPYNIKFACLPQTVTVDAAFKKQDIPKTLDVDVLLQKRDILETFGADADFLKTNIIESFAVDAHFGSLLFQTVSRQIDVLFKKLDNSRTFGADSAFKKPDITKSLAADTAFRKQDIQRSFSIDAHFGTAAAETYAVTFGLNVIFAYKVRLPELWLDENGKLVLNVSRPYTWVGT